MTISKPFAPFVLMFASLLAHAEVPEAPKVEVSRNMRYTQLPDPGIADKKIYINFEGSEKMTLVLQEKLKSRGFTVVKTPEEAEAAFKLMGIWEVTGAGKEPAKGKLGELFEQTIAVPDPKSPDYKHQNTDLLQVAVARAATGSFSSMWSVTDMTRWFAQTTGIAGRVNEFLTGDARGICVGEQCTKFSSGTMIAVLSETTNSGHWWGRSWVKNNDRVTLDQVIPDQLEAIMKPFYDLRPLP